MTGPIVYTDGACLGNPGPGGWGVRVLQANGQVEEYGGAEAATTNNRMELQGAIAALEVLRGTPRLTLYTDSRYVIDGITRWLPGWRRRNWLTAANTPVKNRQLWQQLEALTHAGVSWQHVRGHSGDPNNDRVDTIARAFATGRPPELFRGQLGAPDDPVLTRSEVSSAMPAALNPARATARPTASAAQATTRVVCYVSLVDGALMLDTDWPTCAARQHGGQYRHVNTLDELMAFCAEHGLELPPDT